MKPTSGQVLIYGVPTTELKTSELARRVGFLFQNPDKQICCNTVREELLFGFEAQGRLDDVARARVDEYIERFGFNGDDEPYLLNRGTRQLLALASVVVLDLPVVVLDEPTTGLDFTECGKVMDIVTELNAAGTTIIMVCHDMEVLSDYAKRAIAMTAGRVVDDGPTFDVLRRADVMAKTHLVPPQIVDISMRLAASGVVLPDSAIAQANSLDEMTNAVVCAKRAAAAEKEV